MVRSQIHVWKCPSPPAMDFGFEVLCIRRSTIKTATEQHSNTPTRNRCDWYTSETWTNFQFFNFISLVSLVFNLSVWIMILSSIQSCLGIVYTYLPVVILQFIYWFHCETGDVEIGFSCSFFLSWVSKTPPHPRTERGELIVQSSRH